MGASSQSGRSAGPRRPLTVRSRGRAWRVRTGRATRTHRERLLIAPPTLLPSGPPLELGDVSAPRYLVDTKEAGAPRQLIGLRATALAYPSFYSVGQPDPWSRSGYLTLSGMNGRRQGGSDPAGRVGSLRGQADVGEEVMP